jgi:predicted PurR-regulated permease PerM
VAERGEEEREIRLHLPKQSQIFFFIVLALMLWLTWLVFRPFVIFMITGVFLAVLAIPIDRFWEKLFQKDQAATERKRRRRDRVAAGMSILTLFLIITVPLILLGFALFNDAQNAVERINEGEVDRIIDAGLDVFYPEQTQEERNATVETVWKELAPRITSALNQVTGALFQFVGDLFIATTVILFVVYYILTDGNQLVAYIKRAAPLPAAQVSFLLEEAHQGLRAVFVGQILTSAIQGGLGGIGFLITGVPSAILWAVVMAILSLLPVVGAFLVWVPAVLYLFLQGEVWQGVFLLAWGVLIVSQVDNFLRPKLIGSRANIHPVFVLLGVLGGVAAFGFIGLFLGPLLVGATLSVLRVWEKDYLDPKLGIYDPTVPVEARVEQPGAGRPDVPADEFPDENGTSPPSEEEPGPSDRPDHPR